MLLNVNFFNQEINAGNIEQNLGRKGFSWSTRMNNNFKLQKTLTAQLSGSYNSIMRGAQGQLQPVYSADVAIKKDWMKSKYSLTIGLADIFDTRIFQVRNTSTYFDFEFERKREHVSLLLHLTIALAGLMINKSNKRAAAQRQLTSMGVKPNPGNFMAANREMDASEAAARAAAMTGTRQTVMDKGVSLRAGAAAFGRNQTNTAGQQVGLSTGSGSAATQSAGAGIGSTLAAGGQVASGYGAQMGAQNIGVQSQLGLGSLMNQSYGIQAQQAGAGMAGLGSLIGTGIGAYGTYAAATAKAASSKGFKEDGEPVSSEEAVEAFKRIPIARSPRTRRSTRRR